MTACQVPTVYRPGAVVGLLWAADLSVAGWLVVGGCSYQPTCTYSPSGSSAVFSGLYGSLRKGENQLVEGHRLLFICFKYEEAMRFPYRYQSLSALLLALPLAPAWGQSAGRLVDHNAIGWFTYNGDHQVSERWAVHTEVQWRRTRLGLDRQQLLSRLGLVYTLTEQVQLSGGYTQLTTYPYGRYPTAELGEPTPENRAYEDISLSSSYGRLQLAHRFRLEQRWLGLLDESNPDEVGSWQYQNRARYQVSGQVPLQGPSLDDGELYVTFFDELFIGFGPNVGQNVFNQNRISAGLGYQIHSNWQLELSYLNQWTQHAEPDPGTQQSVFENNNGFRFNVVYNLDFTRAHQAAP